MGIKKTAAVFMMLAAAVSCTELNRDNPYDPTGSDYIGITYKGEINYPVETSLRGMAHSMGSSYFTAYKQGTGDCILKMTEGGAFIFLGGQGTGTGNFTGISGLCADADGNVYITDSQNIIQVLSPFDSFTSFSAPEITETDRLYIEEFNGYLYITSHLDSAVYRYTTGGAYVDSRQVTFTAFGDFRPGRIFRSNQYLFIVNDINRDEVIKMGGNLVTAGEIDFGWKVIDGTTQGEQMQVLSESAVFKVDNNLDITLKWGDFGDGPGRVLNGKLISFNPSDSMVYILDGEALKIFGE